MNRMLERSRNDTSLDFDTSAAAYVAKAQNKTSGPQNPVAWSLSAERSRQRRARQDGSKETTMHLERPLRPRQQLTGYAGSPTGLEMSSADCSFRLQP